MSNKHIQSSGMLAAPGSRQANAATASASTAGPFAETRQQADRGAVRQLFSAAKLAVPGAPKPYAEDEQDASWAAIGMPGAAAPEPELSGTGFTYRHNWGPRQGQWVLRLNWAAITPRSRVLVAIGEGAAGGPDAGKFIGSARYSLHNVAPRAGGVDIWVNVEWSASLLLYVDYLIVNP